MASSVFRPQLRLRLPNQSSLRRVQALAERAMALAKHDPRRFLWLALWVPFWVGSDVPAPAVPGRGPRRDAIPADGDAGRYLTSRADQLVRQFAAGWTAGALLRGLSLALLAVAAWVLLAILGVAAFPGWLVIWSCIAVGVVVGGIYGWLVRPDRLMVAIMLDRTFGLRERLVTAFDRSHGGGHVSRLQLADAANTFDDAQAELPRAASLPIREAALCLIVAGGLLALLLAYVPHDRIGPVASDAVPQFLPASERLVEPEQPLPDPPPSDQPAADQASIAEIQERGRQSQSTRSDLAAVGDALEDHALTKPAADAIDRGDYGTAAESLRGASQSIASMSQEERDALADDLDEAAQEISEENPELAQQVRETADAVRKGGPEAEQAVNDLADQIEETGEQVESQDDLARDLDEAQTGSDDTGEQGTGDQQQGESGSDQGSDQGEGGSQGDPGQGSAAEPGLGSEDESSGQPADQGSSSEGATDEGAGQGSSSESESESSSSDQSGDGTGQGDSANGEGGDSSSDPGMTGNPDDETDAAQGSGSGTGQSNANDQASESEGEGSGSSEQTPSADVPGEGEAGDPPPSRGDRGEQDDGRGSDTDGGTSLELEGTSDEGVQTGGDSGTSSLGSGSDASSGSGDQAQTEVGLSGPDSNRVPDALRDIVRDFFEEEP